MPSDIRVSAEPIDAAALMAALTGQSPDDGAVSSFVGQVRAEGDLVALELEHYPGVTEAALRELSEQAMARWSLSQALIHHRVGRMAVGETIVVVAASAPHRRAALEAVSFLIDRLKTEAPFWKRVHTAQGHYWVEARDSDTAASQYWRDQIAQEDA
ncbi:molybdenum cofactor biosynthesis protein MoaE [uncultured Maricaulis sp.]|uniref:molybdenum cofactor biosynthesis protein MoaE n=1 Tax=uncultured Maricaulis sp. TaxID=174710 RepID=UPI00262B6F89|nr:molybdenum cofactor biosynthesis protein MoaE [uncultured Maricaulis sp.]